MSRSQRSRAAANVEAEKRSAEQMPHLGLHGQQTEPEKQSGEQPASLIKAQEEVRDAAQQGDWKAAAADLLAKIPNWPRREMHDENYLDQKQRIQEQLQELLKADKSALPSFLHRYPRITCLNANEAKLWLSTITNDSTRQALTNYIVYACRFLEYASIRVDKATGQSAAVVELCALERPTCNTLAARIGSHVIPDVVQHVEEDEEQWLLFNAPELHLPDEVRSTLMKANARIVQLRDDPSKKGAPTVLHEIEAWFHDPACLTFLVHGDNPPTILCLIGENIAKKAWRDADKLITAIQRAYFQRKQGGRKKDREQLAVIEKQAALPGPQIGKLGSLGYYGAPSSQQSALSRARRESRKRKKS